MKWWRDWGEHVDKLVSIQKLGKEVKALDSMPELSEYEREMEHHFNMLHSKRLVPFTEIEAYCRLRGIDALDEKEELLSIITGIGRVVYVEAKTEAGKPTNKPVTRRRTKRSRR